MKNKKFNFKENVLIELVLKKARERKNWDYYDVAKKLNDTNINEKTVKKWEYGLIYPNLDIIYKLSELYQIPSETLIQARNNSLNYGYKNIRFKFIDWLCYMANISIMASIVFNLILVYIIAPIFAFSFFVACVEQAISRL